jgi:sugar porter (SP) family MFS transporter
VTASINTRYVAFLACTAALGGLLFGFDIAIITGAGPFITREFSLSDIGLGWAFSSLLFGCVLGCFIAGRLTDRYGRKKLLVIVAVLFAMTSIATALANGFTPFVTARFLGGLAVGGVSLLSPMYVAEVSPPSIRGRMGTLYQMSIITGILVSYSINFLLRNTGQNNWRWMFLTGVIPSAIFLLFIALAPESPRFLAMTGKLHEAFALLERIGGTKSARDQISEIAATMHREPQSWRGLLRPGVRRALAVSACLAVLIHVSGINTIIDYAPAIFQSAGWKVDGALASTFIVGVTEFVFTIVSFWVIDRYGRKPLHRGLVWHGAFSSGARRYCFGRTFSRSHCSHAYPDLPCFFCRLHRARILDTGAGDFSERCAWDGNDCTGAHSVGCECDRCPRLSICVSCNWQSIYLRLSRTDGIGSGSFYMALRARDQEQTVRGN